MNQTQAESACKHDWEYILLGNKRLVPGMYRECKICGLGQDSVSENKRIVWRDTNELTTS